METRSAPTGDTGRDDLGRFRPGHSGNPAGKKPGTRHLGTMARESLQGDEARRLMRVTIEAGLEGSVASARWVLERAFPRARGREIDLGLPPGATVADAIDAVLAALVGGAITPDEAGQFFRSLDRRGGGDRIGGAAAADEGAAGTAEATVEAEPGAMPAPARPAEAAGDPAPDRAGVPVAPAAPPTRPAAPVLPMNRAQRRAAAAAARRAGRPEPAFRLHSPGGGAGGAASAPVAAAG